MKFINDIDRFSGNMAKGIEHYFHQDGNPNPSSGINANAAPPMIKGKCPCENKLPLSNYSNASGMSGRQNETGTSGGGQMTTVKPVVPAPKPANAEFHMSDVLNSLMDRLLGKPPKVG